MSILGTENVVAITGNVSWGWYYPNHSDNDDAQFVLVSKNWSDTPMIQPAEGHSKIAGFGILDYKFYTYRWQRLT